jgi:homocitrate synthase NifV
MTTEEIPENIPELSALPHVSDATLRDSAHMAGVEFGPRDAAAIARLLVRTGVDRARRTPISCSPPMRPSAPSAA